MGSGQSRHANATPVRANHTTAPMAPAVPPAAVSSRPAPVPQDQPRAPQVSTGFGYDASGNASYQLPSVGAQPPPPVAPVSTAPAASLESLVPVGYSLVSDQDVNDTFTGFMDVVVIPVIRELAQVKHSIGKFSMFRDFTHEDEICPLSHELIKNSVIPFDPTLDARFFPGFTEAKTLETSCGHRFSGIYLIYHFMKNDTTVCPVCKQGDPRKLLTEDDIPDHWLAPMAAQIYKEKMAERSAQA